MNDLTAFMSVGDCAALIALNLSRPGLIPCGVKNRTKVTYFSITEEAFLCSISYDFPPISAILQIYQIIFMIVGMNE